MVSTCNKPSKRIGYLDLLKAICIVGIMITHVSPPTMVLMIRTFIPVLLVTISAFMGGVSYKKHYNVKQKTEFFKDYMSYFISRFKRLVIPAWILIIVYFIYQFLIGNTFGLKYYIASFMLTTYGMSYVWIVLVFLYVALLVPIFCRYETQKKSMLAVVATLYIIYEVMYFLGIGTESKLLNSSFFYIVPYGLIAFIGINYNEYSDSAKKKIIGVSGFIFLILFVVYWIKMGSIQDVQIAKYPPRVYYLSCGLFISYALMYFCERHYFKIYDSRVIRFLSVNMFELYLCHVMAMEFYKTLGLPQNWLLELVFVFIASIGMVWILLKVKKK